MTLETTDDSETRTCPECGEDVKPITVDEGKRVIVIRCPVCEEREEIPQP